VAEEQLDGGIANAGKVVRVGPHVLRPSTSYSGSIHALLSALRRAGFEGVPAPVGIDEDGRERLTFIEGDVPIPPYPEWSRSELALASIARLLRGLHDAARNFDARGLCWDDRLADPAGGTLVCHNDVELSNVVFRDGVAVALLDFEFAAPGRPIYDLAQLARLCVPIDDDLDQARLGWRPADRRHGYESSPTRTDWIRTVESTCSRHWTMPSTASKQPRGAASMRVTRMPSRS
jgi:hypothetical protein